jgi:hypothetical protein
LFVGMTLGLLIGKPVAAHRRDAARSYKIHQGNAYTLNSFFTVALVPPRYWS